jgi:hypothetical protein
MTHTKVSFFGRAMQHVYVNFCGSGMRGHKNKMQTNKPVLSSFMPTTQKQMKNRIYYKAHFLAISLLQSQWLRQHILSMNHMWPIAPPNAVVQWNKIICFVRPVSVNIPWIFYVSLGITAVPNCLKPQIIFATNWTFGYIDNCIRKMYDKR